MLMSSSLRAALERIIIFSLAGVFIAEQLTHWEPLALVLGCLVFIAIAYLLPHLRGLNLWLTVSFMVVGAVLFLLRKSDAAYWFEAAGTNVTIVTLFVFAPLFGIPVRLPAYLEALNRFYATRVRSRSVLFAGTQLLTQILGVFLNVGSISVVYHLVSAKPRPAMSVLLANALNRGFAGAIFWSPYFAAMAVVLSSLSVGWSEILPYLLGLSVLSFLVSLAVDYKALREEDSGGEGPAEDTAGGRSAFPAGLAVYLASAIVVVLILERTMELSMVLITCLAAVLFPWLWCLAKGSLSTYRQELGKHVTVTLPALKKEMALFLAAGFFSGSIGTTGIGAGVPYVLELIPVPVALSFSVLTVALILISSMAGLHPIVLVTILATGIDPAAVQISPAYFAVLLLGSWGVSNPISPASAVNNLLAGLFKKQAYELAWSNYKFAVCMAVMLLFYLLTVMP